MTLLEMLKPARQPGEKFDDYRQRRALCNKLVKLRLRGRLVFNSRPGGLMRLPNGTIPKGVTYIKGVNS